MKFLTAIDGSRPGRRALEHAMSLAEAAGADLTVVHAVDPAVRETDPDVVSDDTQAEQRLIQESTEDAEQRGKEALEEAVRMAADREVDVETEMLYGNPVEAVPEFAAGADFDGIFVGHRDLSEEAERVVGSVAKALIERSSVPVTVVP